jgi:hypothetical protein
MLRYYGKAWIMLGARNHHLAAGAYGDSLALRLQHMCDAALVLEAVHDDSDIVRIIPDPKRQALDSNELTPISFTVFSSISSC